MLFILKFEGKYNNLKLMRYILRAYREVDELKKYRVGD